MTRLKEQGKGERFNNVYDVKDVVPTFFVSSCTKLRDQILGFLEK